ncbi:exodeoxyribonuclease V subunit alpha [Halomonas huangheensis]|uniref:RecBCD enzyme subunit RecD n=1 Tax=Halomonas huangheensis TaxID=1178482 RepID=W1N4C8_9GAMM|nr:exodeoxyribonuclease V subunit alpha [Halomonas huangheensis]ALM51557.1 exodeoxyribonuclease V subunit alpha [Halomonas huangheensis]ERL50031.1 hypothetical protein BJB45_02570 [Halomonas huangheensis]
MSQRLSSVDLQRVLDDREALMTLLTRWVERGWLRAIDRAFTEFLSRECPDASALLLLAAALASHQLGRGHLCLALGQTLAAPDLALSLPPEGDDREDPPPLPSMVLDGLSGEHWSAALHHPELVQSGDGESPLVAVGNGADTRLYLRRYWQHEQSIRHYIGIRLQAEPLPAASLRPIIDSLFPAGADLDWQRLACALAARSAFAVITGGPGTGKTTTVVKLLALLQSQALDTSGRALRIRLAAPTGKAAARLNASIAAQLERLDLNSLDQDPQTLREAIPSQVVTLHRLLGSRPDTRRLRHNANNPLPLDVLVVDEASMVDVELMAAMLEALPSEARLVLLGDKDQLASVEAGSVLGDLCQRAEGGHYREATRRWLAEASGQDLPDCCIDDTGNALDQAVTMLRVSHRFDANSGIGQLASAINSGDPDATRKVLGHGYGDLSSQRLDADDQRLERLAVEGLASAFPTSGARGYSHYLGVMNDQRPAHHAEDEQWDSWARAVLDAHGSFQVLCALRRGRWGIEGLNQRITRALASSGWLPQWLADIDGDRWFAGRPVLVTRNDYGLGLMNGDIGITLARPHPENPHQTTLRVAFAAGDGSDRIRWVLPARLRDVETVFAMTVHKSQGSEFDHTALILPEASSPILTRELIYTGITRARRWLSLVETGPARVLDQAVMQRVMRISGLQTPQ